MVGFKLPPQNHPAREAIGDFGHLVEVLNPANFSRLPAIWQARRSALDFLDANPAARQVNSVIVRQDTAERWLIAIGRRGGWRKVWNFGTGRD